MIPVALSRLTSPEVHQAISEHPVLLLPIGAIEAHGPHLPIDTDVIIAVHLAERATVSLRTHGTAAWTLPPLTYSVSWVGSGFSGTIPIAGDVFESYLGGVLAALERLSPAAIVVVNAHLEPAHVAAIRHAAKQAEAATAVTIVFPDQREPRWSIQLSPEFHAGQRHGGSYETSLMLAADRSTVRTEVANQLRALPINLPERLKAGAKTFQEAGGLQGYFGDPASASVSEGERLYGVLESIILQTLLESGVLSAGGA
ncbi:creatininase family protein [soil metagenome]